MKLHNYFSFSQEESVIIDEQQGKIELESCSINGIYCKNELDLINRNLRDALKHRQDKNYLIAIKLLKEAYLITNNLQESPCVGCVDLFRTVIINSLEKIHKELHKMTTGIFGNKHYKSMCLEAGNLLIELKEGKFLIQHLEVRTAVQVPILDQI
jgi:hypothetical protein